MRGTAAVPVETSRQTTNSWGLRGPEPEPDAPLRGIVLGDSYHARDVHRRRRYARRNACAATSAGGSKTRRLDPEHGRDGLLAGTILLFADGVRRPFPPHFVVVSVFANDCGDEVDAAIQGEGDWYEAKYWLEQIVQYCRARRWPCLIVAAPSGFA